MDSPALIVKLFWYIQMHESIIEEWQIHKMGDGQEVFTGTIVTDPKGRFNPGDHIRSSVIKSFNRFSGLLQTQNTSYLMDMATENQDKICTYDWGDGVLGLFY